MRTIYPTLANASRFIIPLLLFVVFFYFFGLSSLKKGLAKDVVAVSVKSSLSALNSFFWHLSQGERLKYYILCPPAPPPYTPYIQGGFFNWSALKMTKSQPLKEF